jgi:hypothetical protein
MGTTFRLTELADEHVAAILLLEAPRSAAFRRCHDRGIRTSATLSARRRARRHLPCCRGSGTTSVKNA